MPRAPATIHCANYLCQAPNLEGYDLCEYCQSPLIHRYLWATGKGVLNLKPDMLIGDRYWVKCDQLILDTKPGLPIETSPELSRAVEVYLKLLPQRLHVPQVYSVISDPTSRTEILLLEQIPFDAESFAQGGSGLQPELMSVWKSGSPLRQLSWLWQIANLWQPLAAQGVASTLLSPDLIRVEGGLIRLLELNPTPNGRASLAELGQLWQFWRAGAQPAIAPFFEALCEQLQQGQIDRAEVLLESLDRGIAAVTRQDERSVEVATRTDKGPTRSGNQDACFPPPNSVGKISLASIKMTGKSPLPLLIVCDGIGGHDNGDLASRLAIATVEQKLTPSLRAPTGLDTESWMAQLEQSVLEANDVISQRNDQEGRHERQRMGTTLVMAVVRGHELLVSHIGDSRAYWITPQGCHQITVDDDLASRETRLGVALYREALQQQSSGSLVQALGMGDSGYLYPTVQRFVVEDEGLLLLCSDGLSDNDLVENFWQQELLPVLRGEWDVATASQRLVEFANRENGHDNVTIGLMLFRVKPPAQIRPQLEASLLSRKATRDPDPADTPTAIQSGGQKTLLVGAKPSGNQSPQASQDRARTRQLAKQKLRSRRKGRSRLGLGLGLGLLLLGLSGLGCGLLYQISPEVKARVDTLLGRAPRPEVPVSGVQLDSVGQLSSPQPFEWELFQQPPVLGSRELSTASPLVSPSPSLVPTPSPSLAPSANELIGSLPVGSIIKVLKRTTAPSQPGLQDSIVWVQVEVCSLPTVVSATRPPLQPTKRGWIQEAAIAPYFNPSTTWSAAQLGSCQAASATSSSQLR